MAANNNTLKVCFIIAGFSPGGAQKQCIYLLNELQKDPAIEIHLLYFYEGIHYHLLNTDNIKLHLFQAGSFYNPKNIKNLAGVIKEINPQIIFSWLHASDVYSGIIRMMLKNVKWIMTERDSYYPFDPRYILRGIIGKRADMIIANSDKGKAYWLKKGVRENKVKVVRNIIKLPAPTGKNKLSGSPVVVYAGRLEPQKNVLLLAEAFCRLAAQQPNIRFYIIGEGTLKIKIEEIIKNNQASEQVIILPFQKDIQDYFVSANAFINISHHEGTPNTVIENIYLGIPVLVSNIDEHSSILGTDYPYLLSDLQDSESLVNMINEILADKNATAKLAYGKQTIADMTAENIAAQYKSLFKESIS